MNKLGTLVIINDITGYINSKEDYYTIDWICEEAYFGTLKYYWNTIDQLNLYTSIFNE